MKLLNLNVWQGRLQSVLLRHLESLDIDIACMQEAVDYEKLSGGLVSTYQNIGKSLGTEYQFFSPLMSMKLGNKDITFGNVTYSKIPFSQNNTIFTRGAHKNDFDFDADDYNVRAFQHSLIEVNNKKLNIINHHGHHIDSHNLGDHETERQVSDILSYADELEGAVIICGDFNLSPESKSIKLIDAKYANLSTKYNLKTTRSGLTYKNEVCDYIFVNDNVIINDFSMNTSIISDHNSLILDFDILK